MYYWIILVLSWIQTQQQKIEYTAAHKTLDFAVESFFLHGDPAMTHYLS